MRKKSLMNMQERIELMKDTTARIRLLKRYIELLEDLEQVEYQLGIPGFVVESPDRKLPGRKPKARR